MPLMWNDEMMWHTCLRSSVSAGLWVLWLSQTRFLKHSETQGRRVWGFGGPLEAWSSEYHQDLRGQKHASAKRVPSYCKCIGLYIYCAFLPCLVVFSPFARHPWAKTDQPKILFQLTLELNWKVLKSPEACGESSRQSEGNTWRNHTMQVLQLYDHYASIKRWEGHRRSGWLLWHLF